MPRRPPRHPPSPSARSRSLELLDQDEKKPVSPVREPEVQARPRSRSLDGLLDEDPIVSDMKTEETSKPNSDNKVDSRLSLDPLDRLSDTKVEDRLTVSQGTEDKLEEAPTIDLHSENTNDPQLNEIRNPKPIPRQRLKAVEMKSEPVNCVQRDEVEKCGEDNSDKEEQHPPTRPPKPNRFVSVDTALSSIDDEKEDCEANLENVVYPCDNDAELKERLVATGNDKSTLLKAKSCGAGLDSDESISSNEYKAKSREQGSLLSLPTGAEPKRKKNFMDKCVNKVRSFIRK